MTSLAAIGLRLHSGWAASVLMAQEPASQSEPKLIGRRRIMLCELPHSKQPYHAAENMMVREAEEFIARCRAATITLAIQALERLREEAGTRKLAGAGLAASAISRLPDLRDILNSHALIHAAEGVFYREALIEAAESSGIKAHAITHRAASNFLDGPAARGVSELLGRIGKAAGPPWTVDEKCACLAALSLLPGPARKFRLAELDEPVN